MNSDTGAAMLMWELLKKEKPAKTAKKKRVQYEIDFIATKGSRKYYIQSALSVASREKELQEKKSLLSVDDSFKKIIIVKDIIKPYCDNDGIVTIGLFDFLQNENSLEL